MKNNAIRATRRTAVPNNRVFLLFFFFYEKGTAHTYNRELALQHAFQTAMMLKYIAGARSFYVSDGRISGVFFQRGGPGCATMACIAHVNRLPDALRVYAPAI